MDIVHLAFEDENSVGSVSIHLRTGLLKWVFVVPECFNTILGTNSHV